MVPEGEITMTRESSKQIARAKSWEITYLTTDMKQRKWMGSPVKLWILKPCLQWLFTSPTRLHLLKVPQPPQRALLDWEQMFKYVNLQGVLKTQTTIQLYDLVGTFHTMMWVSMVYMTGFLWEMFNTSLSLIFYLNNLQGLFSARNIHF